MSTESSPAGATGAGPETTRPARRLRRTLGARPEIVLVPLIFVAFVLIWELGVKLFDVQDYILPTPTEIVDALLSQIPTARFQENFLVTLTEIGIGFFFAVVLAFTLGTLISQIRIVEKAVLPYIVAFQTVPKVALAPLFLIWFGFGMTSKVVMTTVIAFFPLLINVIEGLRSVDADKIEMLRSLGASKFQIFRMVRVPNATPFIFAGLDLGIIFAVIGAVVGEFVGADAGLGYQLLQYNYEFNIAGMFATLIVLSALGLAGHVIVRLFQRRYAFWATTDHVTGS